MGLFDRWFGKKEKASLDQGLQKTKQGFLEKLSRAWSGKSRVDEEVLENLEEALITSDVGISTTEAIIERIEKRVSQDKYLNTEELSHLWQVERRFEPQISREHAASRMAEWEQAVRQTVVR